MSIAVIELPLLPRAGLRVSCQKQGDQLVHVVCVAALHGETELLRSVDADFRGEWPCSPPWQELHVHEESSGGKVLMLVGRAGASHWSMAISADDARRAIVFDVACRVRSRPEFLSSTYRWPAELAPAPRAFANGIELFPAADGAPPVVLQPLAIDGERSPLVEVRDSQIVVKANADTQPPATIRWKYCVRFAE